MPIYLPRQIIRFHPTHAAPLFFLGGPIRGGGDWQAFMAERIIRRERYSNITCPSRWSGDHRLAPLFYQPFSQAKNRQLIWERHYLKQAGLVPKVPGCVIFWLGLESLEEPHPGPEPYAMDTRREVGKFTAFLEVLKWFPELADKMEVRLVIGGDPAFYGLSTILGDLNEAFGSEFPFYESMAETVDQAFLIARR